MSVTQKGGTPDSTQWRDRSFTYDSLSQILSASNPESGTISYTYDNNGNVTSKVAPLPNQTSSLTVTTNYQYDVLNRLLGKSYVGMSTASSTYGYDGIAPTGCTPPTLTDSYPIGRRTAICDGSGATSWAHDSMGQIKNESRKVTTTTRNFSYGYNLDGSLASVKYPTGRVVSYIPGGAGRPLSATDSTGPINYVSAAQYAPFGGLTSMTMGSSPITITNAYSGRLQPVLLSASTTAASILSLCYDFHLGAAVNIPPCTFAASSSGDNGNVFQIVNNRDNNRTQNFMYDSLNRIQQAYTNGPNWGETFSPVATAPGVKPTSSGIDPWGNLTNRSGVTGKTNYEDLSCPANAQNQLTTCSLSYDAAGNAITNGSATYTYDAENRIATAGGETYLYDGDGNRVARVSSGNLYWRDLDGNTLLEDSDGGTNLREYIYFNGQRVARRDVTSNTVHYIFSDHLGSTSVITDALGTMSSCNGYTSGQFESDYYPYGGEQPVCANLGDQHYKFTGKERDAESGNDYFPARYYSSSFGRWLSPDWSAKAEPVPYAKLENPQSLNLYSYMLNNPVSGLDPDGHAGTCGGKDGSSCKVTVTQITQKVNFYDKKGNVVSTVKVTTEMTTVSNSKTGAIVSASASATAENVSGAKFSSSQLSTIGSTVGAVQQAGASMALGSNPAQLTTAIAAKESTLGIAAPTNPLQLSCSSGTCANGDTSHNIQDALNVLQKLGKKSNYDPASTYSRYNGVPDLVQRRTNVNNFMNIFNGMTQSSWGWSPAVPAPGLPSGLQ